MADECQDALRAADSVIQKQDEMIGLVTNRYYEVMDDNARLTQDLVEMKDQRDKARSSRYDYTLAAGLIGVALGIWAAK